MKYIRRANERGAVNMGWLNSKHSFSFGNYFDPQHMGISALRVINDDIVAPGMGFGTHGHKDMEIISYVVEGALEHKDSEGNIHTVPAGDVQRMSAGTGIMHSEYNASKEEPVNFLQIWILPQTRGITPGYEQMTIETNGKLTPLVTKDGSNGSLSMNQDASIAKLELKQGESYSLKNDGRIGYLHLIKGELQANLDAESQTAVQTFSAGDAFAIDTLESINVSAANDVEALWFDLPAVG